MGMQDAAAAMRAPVIRYVANDVEAWVRMPASYEPAEITMEDCRQDSALRVLTDEYGEAVEGLDPATRAALDAARAQG